MNAIEAAFQKEGYTSIPFTFNGVGHPYIIATLANNVRVHLLLDTGAAISLLDHALVQELKLPFTPTGEKGSGAGGLAYDIFSLGEIALEAGGQIFRFDDFYSMDFSSIKEGLHSREVTEEVHGILGYGFFQMTKCFIDYAGSRIFILNQ